MGRRDRFRAFLASDKTRPAPNRPLSIRTAPQPLAQQSSPSQAPLPSSRPDPPASSPALSPALTSHSVVLEKALAKTLEKLPKAEKAAFAQASKTIDERTLLSNVQRYDAAHKDDSIFRPHAERLSKFLNLLNRFMGGVAIGIQASPEISALVVGSVRVVIDLALKFTMYFSKLTDMICTFEDYLSPLAEYAKAADIKLVETTVVNAYANVLEFSWKARRVFVDANGDQRKWTSLRVFIRQHWETFELEFATIKEDLQHHLYILLHSVPSLHFDFSRKTEQARRQEEGRKERSEFLAWVSSIDFEKTHQDTFAKKHENTCDWLKRKPKYQQWSTSAASSLLWCHGKPGIGKSVLASSVIEDITTRTGLREDVGICFAYYNYRDTQLKELHLIIAALLKQLCRRKDQLPLDLLQTKRDALSSSLVGTQERFISLVEDLSQVYVVFDALDECPEQERGAILGFITGIVTAQVDCQVKVFITSRYEMDIAEAFGDKHIPTIQIRTENVTTDIETFARSQVAKLQAGEHGKRLYVNDDKLKEMIIHRLATKAEGMFLWVNLQLDSLCQASKARKDQVLEAALEALPQGLPDTYVRILERIEGQSPYMRELALNCLAWTVYARRPLRTRELQCALAINSECTVNQDIETNLPDVEVILEACGNLLEETNDSIRPIHYTVQEFLTDAVQGLSQPNIRAQLLDPNSMHGRLSLACLTYIRVVAFGEPAEDFWGLSKRLRDHNFAGYACQSFDYHVFDCKNPSIDIVDQIEALLRQESACLAAILQIRVLRDAYDYWTISERFNRMDFLVTPGTIVYSTSLYYVSTVRQRWVDQTPPAYALHLAASAGLTSAVTRLLEAGCNVDEKDGTGSTCLYYSCLNGELDTAQVLIEKHINVNAEGGFHGNSLQAASFGGHKQIVKMLLDNKADVNAQGGYYGNALQAASFRGHKQIVKMLLDNKADVNAQGGQCSNALQAASIGGHEQIVKMLLDNSADVNAQGGDYGNALQAASFGGREQIIKMLLHNNADVNAQGGEYGNALQAASIGGNERIVKMLLDNKADVNAQGGYYGNALQAASIGGNEQIVKILLDNKADVNAQGGYYGNALQAASFGGCEQIVKILLDNKADVNAQGGDYGNALQAASLDGSEQIVKMLLDNKADVNAQGGPYGNALQAASLGGHEQIVKMLLDNEADVSAQGGYYGNALQAASYEGHEQIVKILLDNEADMNAQGGYYGSALQAASFRGHEQIVKMLLDNEADVNAQGGEYGNALQAASCGGHEQIVKMLLDNEADVNAQGGRYGSALQAASFRGHEQIVKILLEAGAQRKEDDVSRLHLDS